MSSSASWIWAPTSSGLTSGRCVNASVTTMLWVPAVEDQLAFAEPSPVISRSSERGLLEPLVVTPLTGARNTTASQLDVVSNHGVVSNVARSGCSTSSGDFALSDLATGSVIFQLARSSTLDGPSHFLSELSELSESSERSESSELSATQCVLPAAGLVAGAAATAVGPTSAVGSASAPITTALTSVAGTTTRLNSSQRARRRAQAAHRVRRPHRGEAYRIFAAGPCGPRRRVRKRWVGAAMRWVGAS